MDEKLIVNKARASLGKFCYEECKAYCCRKGYLVLDEKEVKKFKGNEDIIKKLDNGKYSLNMNKRGCPCLEDYKCKIYKTRPKVCREFPIFVNDKTIRISPRCLAVKEDLLYPYIAKLIKMGYKIQKNDDYGSLEGDVFNSIQI